MSYEEDMALAKKFETHLFKVHVLENYDWTLPQQIRENKVAPVFGGGDSLSFAQVSMLVICDMINNNIEFEVYDYHNFFLMKEILLSYRYILNLLPEASENAIKCIQMTEKPLLEITNICNLLAAKYKPPEDPNAPVPMIDMLKRFKI